MEYKRIGDTIALRLDPGDEIVAKILEVAQKENVPLGSVTGIGGTDDVTGGVFNMEKKGYARSVDIAAGLDVSKPSVSVAMRKLRENGYISMGSDNLISLTDRGYAIARRIYDRHQALTKYLAQLGVPEEIAREDACRMEHDLSEESFAAICAQIRP